MTAEEQLFFAGRPEALPTYEAFRTQVLGRFPQAEIRVARTQITVSQRYGFAVISHPRRKSDSQTAVLLSFGLSHRVESPRIWAASQPYPGRWTHHVIVASQAELDEEVMGWVQEAHDFALVKGRGK